jgi:hypothetical protein
MPSTRLFAALAVVGALTASAAPAAAAPPFPRTYHGTITGTFEGRDRSQGTTTKSSWTIKGVGLRLGRVIKTDASWSVPYVVTGGTVTYHEAETGSCTHALDATLPLRTLLDEIASPFALSQSLFFNHKTTALGQMIVKQSFKVTETCSSTYPDEPPTVTKRTVQMPTLFDPGEKRVTLGKAFVNRNKLVNNHAAASSTVKWSWVLKPGR